jgi:hypothetical protein
MTRTVDGKCAAWRGESLHVETDPDSKNVGVDLSSRFQLTAGRAFGPAPDSGGAKIRIGSHDKRSRPTPLLVKTPHGPGACDGIVTPRGSPLSVFRALTFQDNEDHGSCCYLTDGSPYVGHCGDLQSICAVPVLPGSAMDEPSHRCCHHHRQLGSYGQPNDRCRRLIQRNGTSVIRGGQDDDTNATTTSIVGGGTDNTNERARRRQQALAQIERVDQWRWKIDRGRCPVCTRLCHYWSYVCVSVCLLWNWSLIILPLADMVLLLFP